jgi:hypothetical protein
MTEAMTGWRRYSPTISWIAIGLSFALTVFAAVEGTLMWVVALGTATCVLLFHRFQVRRML